MHHEIPNLLTMESTDGLGCITYKSNEFQDKYVHMKMSSRGKVVINSLPSTVLDRPFVEDIINKHVSNNNLERLTNTWYSM